MNELTKVFNYGSSEVRTIVEGDEIWFVAKDICDQIDVNVTQTRRLNAKQKGLRTIQTLGGMQQMTVVNEAGLYKLVFTSRKEEAEQFTDWIAEVVLPSIRKTGSFSMSLPQSLPDALRAYANEVEAHESTRKALETAQPKAEYFDALVDRNLLTSLRDTAKELQVGERKFINWLLQNKYIFRDPSGKLKPYAKHTPVLFELKEWERNGKAGNQTMVTPRGRETLRLMMATKKPLLAQ
ncbi:phage antirepressor Ant [Bacillus sp. C1-1]|nr:phage antirepressor Ant [Bacillus sp. C1-1]